jgi:hypothetical protein
MDHLIQRDRLLFPLFTLLFLGDSDSSRDGDRLKLHAIQVVFSWKLSTATPCFIWMVTFNGNLTVCLFCTILTRAPFTYYNHDLRQQYDIPFDEFIELESVSYSSHCVKMIIMVKFSLNLQFSAGGMTSTNHIYIYAILDGLFRSPVDLSFKKILFYTDN